MLRPKNFKGLLPIILIAILALLPVSLLKILETFAEGDFNISNNPDKAAIIEQSTLLGPAPVNSGSDVAKRIKVIVTAYSSSPYETFGDPFETASGERVRDGIVANNLLPFNTKIRLPQLFGDKVFIVKDRMNSKKGYYHIDIWFPSRESALAFGSKLTYMEVLNY